MKHPFKVIVISAILTASLPALASIDSVSTGNGSLVLTVLDRNANVSATFDLGKNYSDFNVYGTSFVNSGVSNQGVNYSWNLASNAAYSTSWNTYLASASLSNTEYAITAADGFGAGIGNAGYITTYKADGNNLLTSSLLAAISSFDAYAQSNMTNGLVVIQNHTDVAHGSSVANTGDALGSIFYSATGKGNNSGPVVMGAIGENLAVAQVLAGASTFAATSQNIFGNGAKFFLGTDGVLSYGTAPVAPVPEPETWATLLVGFGLLGFAVRRKKDK